MITLADISTVKGNLVKSVAPSVRAPIMIGCDLYDLKPFEQSIAAGQTGPSIIGDIVLDDAGRLNTKRGDL